MIRCDFIFPSDKTLHFGIVKNFDNSGAYPKFGLIDILKPLENILNIDKVDYFFTYLHGSDQGNKGGNSIILKLFDAQNIDPSNPDYNSPDLILKILKSKKNKYPSKGEKRFLKEIEAIDTCTQKRKQNIIEIYHSGTCKILNSKNSKLEEYAYYTMEPADCDLKEYIENNHESLTELSKISLCLSLAKGLEDLRSLGYYHRDIKPDNIFMIGNTWKIGDLGLIDERDTDLNIDKVNEFIGPRGWISPEAMNKFLCEKRGFKFDHNCNIDHQSDIFQLGKVFWYIFQHNAPIGTVKTTDFYYNNSQLFAVIKRMLNHNKKRRFHTIAEVIKDLKPLEFALSKVS